ncbi:unnamed protein product [Pedinophyceae sp. YPF-701]|nr:unnamed protein product [Pedinophyceae sp. YPF-701]
MPARGAGICPHPGPSRARVAYLCVLTTVCALLSAFASPALAAKASCAHEALEAEVEALYTSHVSAPAQTAADVHLQARGAGDASGLAGNAGTGGGGLRVALDFQLGGLAPSFRETLTGTILPRVVAKLSRTLAPRRPTQGTLFLPRTCETVDQSTGQCRELKPIGNCFFAQHEPSYFSSARVCDSTGACTDSPPGAGVPDADVVLYVTAETSIGSQVLCDGGFSAFGAPCSFDSTGRPLAGVVNLCPRDRALPDAEIGQTVDLVLHEALHALGFSSASLSRFVDGDGARVPRSQVVQNVGGRNYVVTPGAAQAARDQFSCPELPGAALENDGSSATLSSHWEARLHDNELMLGATEGRRALLSRLTLALLDDSGWYDVDVESGAMLQYGLGAGCGVVEARCGVDDQALRDLGLVCSPSEEMTCSYDHLTYGDCRTTLFADGCPQVVASDQGECQNELRQGSLGDLGMHYGAYSRCLPLQPGGIRRRGSRYTERAGCFRTSCSGGQLMVSVGGSAPFACPAGETVDLADVSIFEGTIGPCPDSSTICPSLSCPDDCSGNGQCIAGKCECYLGHRGSNCAAVDSTSLNVVSQGAASTGTAFSGDGASGEGLNDSTVTLAVVVGSSVLGAASIGVVIAAFVYLRKLKRDEEKAKQARREERAQKRAAIEARKMQRNASDRTGKETEGASRPTKDLGTEGRTASTQLRPSYPLATHQSGQIVRPTLPEDWRETQMRTTMPLTYGDPSPSSPDVRRGHRGSQGRGDQRESQGAVPGRVQRVSRPISSRFSQEDIRRPVVPLEHYASPVAGSRAERRSPEDSPQVVDLGMPGEVELRPHRMSGAQGAQMWSRESSPPHAAPAVPPRALTEEDRQDSIFD